jgi:aspartate-semialdehyde dehydrogenase
VGSEARRHRSSSQSRISSLTLGTSPIFGAHRLDLFVCRDQLLKGVALNAVQIAGRMV